MESEERLIEEINAALARMDQGLYGRCEACRQDIAKERLQAVPYARQCVRCARKTQRQATR